MTTRRRRQDMEFSEDEVYGQDSVADAMRRGGPLSEQETFGGPQADMVFTEEEAYGAPVAENPRVAPAAQLTDPRQHQPQSLEDVLAGYDVDRMMAEESDRMQAEQPPTPRTPPAQANVGARRDAGPTLTTDDWLGRMDRAGDRADMLSSIAQMGGYLDQALGGGQRGEVYRGLQSAAQAPVERLKSSYQMWKDAQDQRLAQEREQRLEASGAAQQDYQNRSLEQRDVFNQRMAERQEDRLDAMERLQGQRLESQANLQGQRLEFQGEQGDLNRQNRLDLAQLRGRVARRSAAGVGGPGARVEAGHILRRIDEAQAGGEPLSDEEYSQAFSLAGSRAGGRAVTLAAGTGRARGTGERAGARAAAQLSERLDRAAIPMIETAMTRARPLVASASDADIRWALATRGTEVPPSPGAMQLRMRLAAVVNPVLKGRSGAQVTDSEQARVILDEAGMGRLAGNRQTLNEFLDGITAQIQAQRSNLEQGAAPAVQRAPAVAAPAQASPEERLRRLTPAQRAVYDRVLAERRGRGGS